MPGHAAWAQASSLYFPIRVLQSIYREQLWKLHPSKWETCLFLLLSISDPPPNIEMLSPLLPLSLLPPPGLPPLPPLSLSSNLYPHLYLFSLVLINPQNHNNNPKRNSETYSRIAFLELSVNNLLLLLLSHCSWHYWAPGTCTALHGLLIYPLFFLCDRNYQPHFIGSRGP